MLEEQIRRGQSDIEQLRQQLQETSQRCADAESALTKKQAALDQLGRVEEQLKAKLADAEAGSMVRHLRLPVCGTASIDVRQHGKTRSGDTTDTINGSLAQANALAADQACAKLADAVVGLQQRLDAGPFA